MSAIFAYLDNNQKTSFQIMYPTFNLAKFREFDFEKFLKSTQFGCVCDILKESGLAINISTAKFFDNFQRLATTGEMVFTEAERYNATYGQKSVDIAYTNMIQKLTDFASKSSSLSSPSRALEYAKTEYEYIGMIRIVRCYDSIHARCRESVDNEYSNLNEETIKLVMMLVSHL